MIFVYRMYNMKSFKFTNSTRDDSFCIVNITVNEKTVGGNTYFVITYTHTFEGDEASRPFVEPWDEDDDKDGVIVVKNAMTQIMVDYLLSDPEELEKVSGTSTAQHYRTIIMKNLGKLWD